MICARCVLPDTFPGLTFDEAGVCSLCRTEPSPEEVQRRRAAARESLEKVYRTVRGKRDYDCLVAYSGGKDSSYTLHALSKTFGLRCLAVTIDNGFLSDQAVTNCRNLTDAIGVDHVFFKPAFAFMQRMYTQSLDGGVHVGSAIKRASAVCNSCIGLVNNHMLKTAFQLDIPIIAGGYLGGQVPKDASLFEFKPATMKAARAVSFGRMQQRFGEADATKFFGLEGFDDSDRSVFVTNPMLVFEVDESHIYETLKPLGWTRPQDTGRHSSNCRLNDFGIHVHLARHKFHPYVAELAEQVRSGLMGREEALERLAHRPTDAVLGPIAQKLGVDAAALVTGS